MKPEFQFKMQVLSWLLSSLDGVSVDEENGRYFDTLVIKYGDTKNIRLTLIDLRSWLRLQSNDGGMQDDKTLGVLHGKEKGEIRLWEDIWFARTDLVKSRLSSILGISQRIPGRVTQVKKIVKPVSEVFLEQNHLQGAVSARIHYGLYLPKRYFRVLDADFQFDKRSEEILVAVATFSHPRTFLFDGQPFKSYELIRFASLKFTTVVGGFDKLLKTFSKEYNPGDIMTYADLEWSEGESYERLGFEKMLDKPPMAFWLDIDHDIRYAKNRAPDNGHMVEVFNAGSRKFVKTFHLGADNKVSF